MKIHMRCLALASAFTDTRPTETRADSSAATSGSARAVPREPGTALHRPSAIPRTFLKGA